MTTTRTRWRAAVAAGIASAVALMSAGPVGAYELPGGLRDVREFACPPGNIPDQGFVDVPERDVFRLEISCLAALGIAIGSGGGLQPEPRRFAPSATLSRAAMAVLLARTLRVAGVDLPGGGAGFTDLDDQPAQVQWAVNGLARARVVQGITPMTFAPGRPVSREQLATFVTRTQDYLAAVGVDQPFAAGPDLFDDGVSAVHRPGVAALAQAGIVQGTGPRTFAPRATVTRVQAAAYLARYVDRLDEARPDVVGFSRNNEVLSRGITAAPPSGSRPAVSDADGADDPRDDVVYTVSRLVPGREYRITLVTTASFTREPGPVVDLHGETAQVVFGGARTTLLADPGATSAVVRAVDGQALPAPSRSVTHTPTTPEGTFTFRIDAQDATEVVPFIYPNQSYDYVSDDPRLELAADLRPVEVFGVGPVARWTAP